MGVLEKGSGVLGATVGGVARLVGTTAQRSIAPGLGGAVADVRSAFAQRESHPSEHTERGLEAHKVELLRIGIERLDETSGEVSAKLGQRLGLLQDIHAAIERSGGGAGTQATKGKSPSDTGKDVAKGAGLGAAARWAKRLAVPAAAAAGVVAWHRAGRAAAEAGKAQAIEELKKGEGPLAPGGSGDLFGAGPAVREKLGADPKDPFSFQKWLWEKTVPEGVQRPKEFDLTPVQPQPQKFSDDAYPFRVNLKGPRSGVEDFGDEAEALGAARVEDRRNEDVMRAAAPTSNHYRTLSLVAKSITFKSPKIEFGRRGQGRRVGFTGAAEEGGMTPGLARSLLTPGGITGSASSRGHFPSSPYRGFGVPSSYGALTGYGGGGPGYGGGGYSGIPGYEGPGGAGDYAGGGRERRGRGGGGDGGGGPQLPNADQSERFERAARGDTEAWGKPWGGPAKYTGSESAPIPGLTPGTPGPFMSAPGEPYAKGPAGPSGALPVWKPGDPGPVPFTTPSTASTSGPSFTPEINKIIDETAKRHGVDPNMLRTFAKIESDGNPRNVTGSYKGLFQLSDAEFEKHGGTGDIFDPRSNAEAAARKIKSEAADFEERFGRAPEPHEIYMIHQQGIGGSRAHAANPDKPAWENMYSTTEGQEKGVEWAKKAIWGNIPKDQREKFGSVENVTSRQFTEMWAQKYGRFSSQGEAIPGAKQGEPGKFEAFKTYVPEGTRLPPGFAGGALSTCPPGTGPMTGDQKLPTTTADAIKYFQGGGQGAEKALNDALKLEGMHEERDRTAIVNYLRSGGQQLDPRDPWCAAFVNAALTRAGMKGTGSDAAGSFLKYGSAVTDGKIQPGDIGVVKGASPRTGMEGTHVGLLTGKTRTGSDGQLQYEMMSGNDMNSAKRSWRNASDLHVRRGADVPQNPNNWGDYVKNFPKSETFEPKENAVPEEKRGEALPAGEPAPTQPATPAAPPDDGSGGVAAGKRGAVWASSAEPEPAPGSFYSRARAERAERRAAEGRGMFEPSARPEERGTEDASKLREDSERLQSPSPYRSSADDTADIDEGGVGVAAGKGRGAGGRGEAIDVEDSAGSSSPHELEKSVGDAKSDPRTTTPHELEASVGGGEE